MKKISYSLIFSLLLLAACKKESSPADNSLHLPPVSRTAAGSLSIISSPKGTDGFGASKRELNGIPFSFPSGVHLNGNVRSGLYACSGNSMFECDAYGTLPFYMSLKNDNSTSITFIFPAGLVLPSEDTTWQGAVIVQADTVTLPPSSYTCVKLDAFCVNDTRTFSSDIVYGNPLITQNTNLNPLMDLLAVKRTITADPQDIIQKAVWDIANTGSLSAADIAAINAFP